ncbi:hypothetical protein GCM10027578_07950 [Spirosoma luteolum]
METIQFKTNIKCGGCIAAVTPFLNKTAGEGHWQVDVKDPNKVLTVDAGVATAEAVRQAIVEAGYKAEPLV